jgi:hypothetical protein
MFTLYNALAVVLAGVVSLGSLVLLLARGPSTSRWSSLARTWVDRLAAAGRGERVTWLSVALVVGVGYAAVAAFDLASGLYGCSGVGQTSDPVALLQSGRAFWSGGNPFDVRDCGASTQIPYGLAAVLVNALGSLGGLAGIAAAWGLLAVAIVPLAWFAAPAADRRYLTLFVVLLPIYFPLVAGQIDGASNAIVPVAVLATVVLARRAGPWSAALGGFLSTARFPSLFPVVAACGPERRRFLAAFAGLGAFAAVTALAYVHWGSGFYHVVFEGQVNRRSFSLNLYGVLLDHGALPSGETIVAIQALAIVLVTIVAFFFVKEPLRAAALALVGFALLTPFLSFSILLALLPIALVGARVRWWLWAAALVGTMNFDLALTVAAWQGGFYLATDLLDVVLTVLLLGLAVELWRERARPLAADRAAAATGPA